MTYEERSVLYCMLRLDFVTKETLKNYVADINPVLNTLKKKGYIEQTCSISAYWGKRWAWDYETYCLTDKGRKIAMDYSNKLDELIEKRKKIERRFFMTFGEALELLKNGKKVARRGWNGKGLWLELQRPDENSKMTLPYVYLNYPSGDKYHDGSRVPWLPSQTDMLEEDWVEVE